MSQLNNSKSANYWAVVPAAGVGKRMASDIPKQYLKLHDKTVIEHSCQRLLGHAQISGIIVALGEKDEYWPALELASDKPVITVTGGQERCHSVLNALQKLVQMSQQNEHAVALSDWVLVHDAARPCLRHSDIDLLVGQLDQNAVGGLLALPVRDTMKRQNTQQCVADTVEREGLWHALTPQMFRLGQLKQAIEEAIETGFLMTDESSAIEHAGLQPLLIEGREDNIKITRPADLKLAEMYLKAQQDE
ncbi:MAG: 2-C-methyl-D-erythritol 4-phosphate cytidylyltransferase [Gammaproteobacteria bacterium]|nr:2-C-methyl-D-erythritol 4-phosphate cytidylyltransferase [Gammaproteobacteria bacterium]